LIKIGGGEKKTKTEPIFFKEKDIKSIKIKYRSKIKSGQKTILSLVIKLKPKEGRQKTDVIKIYLKKKKKFF
jgi:hypothetical protein